MLADVVVVRDCCVAVEGVAVVVSAALVWVDVVAVPDYYVVFEPVVVAVEIVDYYAAALPVVLEAAFVRVAAAAVVPDAVVAIVV